MRRVLPEEALLPYSPTPSDPFDRKKAAHLARRAGFGATSNELDGLVENGLGACLKLLEEPKGDGGGFQKLFDAIEGELLDLQRGDGLQSWWLYRMLHSPDPLRERMTLFWHDHFATSLRKVGQPRLMMRQNELFRRLGLGGFRELLLEVSRDPAMLIWLDNRYNVKGRPNENYARELMELFTLGRDHYTEGDIKEVARAFTGWHLRGTQFWLNERAHDSGPKTIFGKTGNFGGEDVIDLILGKRECATFIAGKIWRNFVGPWAPGSVITELANGFRKDGYHIGRLVGRILRSRGFFSAQAWRSRIAGPLGLVCHARRLGIKANVQGLSRGLAALGQNLFYPPTVEGWKEEEGWLSANWDINRINAGLGLSALRGGKGQSRFEAVRYGKEHALDTPAKLVDHFVDLLADGDVPEEVRTRLLYFVEHQDPAPRRGGTKGDRVAKFKPDATHLNSKVRGLVRLVLALPESHVC